MLSLSGRLRASLNSWCEHHGSAYRGVAAATLNKGITGRGNTKKPANREYQPMAADKVQHGACSPGIEAIS
jgi:hypothetical protein